MSLKQIIRNSFFYTEKFSPSGLAIFLPSIPISTNMIYVEFDLQKLNNLGSFLLTWINFGPSMNKLWHAQKGVLWNSFSNFNGLTAKLWEWINNSITHFKTYVITHPCFD